MINFINFINCFHELLANIMQILPKPAKNNCKTQTPTSKVLVAGLWHVFDEIKSCSFGGRGESGGVGGFEMKLKILICYIYR